MSIKMRARLSAGISQRAGVGPARNPA